MSDAMHASPPTFTRRLHISFVPFRIVGQVVRLEYEAYDTMALKATTKICEEMRIKWSDIQHIAMHHRLGVVPVKESSVIIAVSSPHRQTSLDAVQFAIDELKRTVPIWKKEIYENEKDTAEGIWKENKECFWLQNPSASR